ncbi:MAG TPA: hypothetical protein VK670_16575 [Silvibacterium sp.]|nr:hypothetical protein [Silvibacterium sp.]
MKPVTNIQFYFAIGIPFFTILVVWIGGTVANRAAIGDLRAEMRSAIDDSRSENRSAINYLRSEMKAGFDSVNRRLDGMESRFDRLEVRFDRMDNEIRKDHEHRVTMLEERVFGRLA